MKKLIFTITTLGLSSLLYASPCVKKIVAKKFATCYTQTVTQYEDKQGNYVRSVSGPRVTTTCAPGQLEGSTKTTYVRALDPYIDLWP